MECPFCHYQLKRNEAGCPRCMRRAREAASAPVSVESSLTASQALSPAKPERTSFVKQELSPSKRGTSPRVASTPEVDENELMAAWRCARCNRVNTRMRHACEECGAPHLPVVVRSGAKEPLLIPKIYIFSLVVFILITLLFVVFPRTKLLVTSSTVIYRGETLNDQGFRVLLIAMEMHDLDAASANAGELVARETRHNNYEQIEIGCYTRATVPDVRPRTLPERLRNDLLAGRAEVMFSWSRESQTLTSRAPNTSLNTVDDHTPDTWGGGYTHPDEIK